MEVNNVHVNRMPLDGRITQMTHFPGYHLRAWKKESDLNERVVITIETEIGEVTVVQLAGLIARRVYPYIKEGDELKKGDRIGIIRLGSRVDVYLPADKIKVNSCKNRRSCKSWGRYHCFFEREMKTLTLLILVFFCFFYLFSSSVSDFGFSSVSSVWVGSDDSSDCRFLSWCLQFQRVIYIVDFCF